MSVNAAFCQQQKKLLDQMINQGVSKQMLLKQIQKTFNRHPEAF